METFAERLERLIKARGISVNEFARLVDKSSGYLSMVLSGQRLPDGNLKTRDASLWAEVLGVDVQELVVEDRRPVIRQLTERELYERFGIKPYDQPMTAEGIYLSAGPGKGVPQGIDDTITRRVPGRKFLWEAPVVGDCMEDEIHPGEVVIYSTRLGAEINKIMVALRDEEELLIKRLVVHNGAQLLRPNRGEDVPVDDRIRFLGRGVSVQRPLL